jgi:5-hydroxyisourate hydrolase
MGRLTTHVLDTASGKPGAGIALTLYRLTPRRRKLCAARTNSDGRCDNPLLQGEAMAPGCYEICFQIGAYFRTLSAGTRKRSRATVPFLDEVVIRFGIDDAKAHYHVPLLVSPFGYSTYRGS